MMNFLIIEDELPAAKRLTKQIQECQPEAKIVEVLDSVKSAVKWLQSAPKPDLIFMDIQLADGHSFEIFTQIEVESPVIFTTAFDQYTLQAFKVNSIDYLLKPIDIEELKSALEKFKKYHQKTTEYDPKAIHTLIQSLSSPNYKERFLVKIGTQLSYINVNDIAYFYSEDRVVYAQTINPKRYIIDFTLDQLENVLKPDDFFRINRKYITNIGSIKKISTWFNSRLKLELKPKINDEVIVSRDRVGDFKHWLDK